MHLIIIERNNVKIAIFWSPRCGHKMLNKFLFSNGFTENIKTLGHLTHSWKDLDFEDLEDCHQILIARNPYKRFYSFIRWLDSYNPNIKSNEDKIEYITEMFRMLKAEPNYIYHYDEPHHIAPQWSQAYIFLDKKNVKVFDIDDFDYMVDYISELIYYEAGKLIKIEKPEERNNTLQDLFTDPKILSQFQEIFRCDLDNLSELGIDITPVYIG